MSYLYPSALWSVQFLLARFSPFVVLAALLLSPLNMEDAGAAPLKKLRVAGILALTGAASQHGESIRKGLELAQSELQATGWDVELQIEDDGTNPARTVTAYKGLRARGFQYFIGPTWSYQTAAVQPLLRGISDVLFIAPACDSDTAGGANARILFGVPRSSTKIEPLAAWLKTQPFKTGAILLAESAWGRVHEQVFQEAAKQAGVKISSVQYFEYGEESVAIPLLLAKLRPLNPDVIFTTTSQDGSALIIKRLREQRFSGALVGTEDLEDAFAGKLVDALGKNELQAYCLGLEINSLDFSARFKKHFGIPPYKYADGAYDALRLLAEATEQTGSLDPGVVLSYIRDHAFKGVRGDLLFDKDGNPRSFPYEVYQIGR